MIFRGARSAGFGTATAGGYDARSLAAPPRPDAGRARMSINLKSKGEIERMRAAGRVVRQVLNRCEAFIRPGVTTGQIDAECHRVFTDAGAKGLFKNYPTYKAGEGFPGNVCISVNDCVVHGIGDDTVIEDGDIVGIDCGVQYEGWCGDAATTVLVGNVDPRTRKLCEITQHVLRLAVENIRPGRRWSQIARLMQGYAESHGLGVVRDFVGHGIGKSMHEDPKVPNFVNRDLLRNDIVLREGLVLAIEPMCTLGKPETYTLADGWTVLTVDGEPSAHYEHTIAVTASGTDVLTDGR